MWYFIMGYVLACVISVIGDKLREKHAVKNGIVMLNNEYYKIEKID